MVVQGLPSSRALSGEGVERRVRRGGAEYKYHLASDVGVEDTWIDGWDLPVLYICFRRVDPDGRHKCAHAKLVQLRTALEIQMPAAAAAQRIQERHQRA